MRAAWELCQFDLLFLVYVHLCMDTHRAAACDVTGGVTFLNFDATELQIFKGNLGSPSNPNL